MIPVIGKPTLKRNKQYIIITNGDAAMVLRPSKVISQPKNQP
jgi:hypothetical protein